MSQVLIHYETASFFVVDKFGFLKTFINTLNISKLHSVKVCNTPDPE